MIQVDGRVPARTWRLARGENGVGIVQVLDSDGMFRTVDRSVVHHSPDGFNWGYCGSGPADLALEMMVRSFPLTAETKISYQLHRGRCSAMAWELHQLLKEALLAKLPYAGEILADTEVDYCIDRVLCIRAGERGVKPEEFSAFLYATSMGD